MWYAHYCSSPSPTGRLDETNVVLTSWIYMYTHYCWFSHLFDWKSCRIAASYTGTVYDLHLRLTAKPHICMICGIFHTEVNTSLALCSTHIYWLKDKRGLTLITPCGVILTPNDHFHAQHKNHQRHSSEILWLCQVIYCDFISDNVLQFHTWMTSM